MRGCVCGCVWGMPPHSQEPDHVGRVPVDTAPGPVPVHRALKNPHLGNCSTVPALSTTRLSSTTTGTSTTLSKNWTPRACPNSQGSGNATSFLTSATVGVRLSSPRRHLWISHHQQYREIDHLVHEQLGNLHGLRDHGKRHLHHDRDFDDLHDLQNGGHGHAHATRSTGR